MNEPLMRVVKRIEDFKERVSGPTADKKVLQKFCGTFFDSNSRVCLFANNFYSLAFPL